MSSLLASISETSPCGDDLEYDPQFLELERAASGQPERRMGDAVLPAEPPDWRKVRDLASQLLQRSKDLRIAHHMLQGSIVLEGFPGLALGLDLIHELLVRYWDGLYPQLDSEDNDPTFRLNVLAGLAAEPIVLLVRSAPLIHSRAFGTISLRAALNAAGLQHFSGETLNQEQLAAALQDSEPEQMVAVRNALSEAQTSLSAIGSEVASRLGPAQGIDFGALKQLLRQAAQVIAAPASPAEGAEAPSVAEPRPASGSTTPATVSAPGVIASRDDVLRSLDRILSYYSQHEPSSPVPVLLARAKSLVSADFATIVRNLIPDGLSQFEKLQGPGPER